MTSEQIFFAWPESRLLAGAELYYADEIKDIRITDPKAKRSALLTGMLPRAEASFPEEMCCKVTGSFSRTGSARRFCCCLTVYEDTGMPVRSVCDCGEDSCAHTAGLMAALAVQRLGENVFRDTAIESGLRNLSGADDPFQPGVLRRSDDRLLSLLHRNADEHRLPVFPKERVQTRNTEPLHADCYLVESSDPEALLLELRIGTSGHRYVVKDLAETIRAWRDRDKIRLGKKEFVMAPAFCDPFVNNLLEMLSSLQLQDSLQHRSVKRFLPGSGPTPSRYIRIRSLESDPLFELLDGKTVNMPDGTDKRVCLSHRGLRLHLKKMGFGATLSLARVKQVHISGRFMYLEDKEAVFRVPLNDPEKAVMLKEMLRWTGPVYIRESDIGSVCRDILPYYRDNGILDGRGVVIEDYETEKPRFRFCLDMDEQGLLSCTPYALYPVSGTEYLLYDDCTDKLRRNPAEENRVSDLLGSIFDAYDPEKKCILAQTDDDRLFDFLKETLPEMEKLGEVLATDAITSRRIRKMTPATVHISVDSGQLVMSLGNTGISQEEMAEILSRYDRKKRFHRLKSGSFISFEQQDPELLESLSELWRHYGEGMDADQLRLPLFRALYVQEMMEGRESAVLEASASYRELVSRIGRRKETPPPESLKKILRPYQGEGFRWIRMLKECGFGGILADDMGLGKTLQVLAFVLSEKEEGRTGDDLRTLIICPASLVYNWEKEIRTFTPGLTSRVISGIASARKELIAEEQDTDIWITSYDLLKRDIALYRDIPFANEVLDEAQFIKNREAQASRSVRIVNSRFRLALTGTPIENHLGELWSILDYLMPGFLYRYSEFQKEFEIPVVQLHDEKRLARLRGLVHPFILRRLKRQVLKDLPEKIEETVSVHLEGEQRQLYDAAAEELRQILARTDDSAFRSGKLQILARLTRLRQICCDPALLYDNYAGGSAKLEACLQLVQESVESGHKLLLFSQFTSMLDIICARLTEEGIGWHRIDGSTDKQERMRLVDSFANDEVPVFCISLKAGGTGLNLTSADIVIHYDPWWNQAAQNQATDRTHRIGQNRRVNVYELIAGNTVEERIMKIKEGKSQLAEDVLSGETAASASINREELLSLLQK